MKLHEIPKQSKIYTETSDGSSYIIFHHLDGLFSYCETEKGGVCHLHINENLKEFKDGYKLDN